MKATDEQKVSSECSNLEITTLHKCQETVVPGCSQYGNLPKYGRRISIKRNIYGSARR